MPQLLKENEVSYYLGEKHIYPKIEGGGGSAEISIITHTSSETTVTINPGEYHVWPEMSALTISLGTPSDPTILNEYMFEFESGSTATNLLLPSSVVWDELIGDLTPKASKIYQVSIVNNIGVWASVDNS